MRYSTSCCVFLSTKMQQTIRFGTSALYMSCLKWMLHRQGIKMNRQQAHLRQKPVSLIELMTVCESSSDRYRDSSFLMAISCEVNVGRGAQFFVGNGTRIDRGSHIRNSGQENW